MTITTKTAKNGVMMYYLDGKRISREKAIKISKNADNEMLTNALGANVELKDTQAILVIETKDPLEVGKYREFGWCFTNVIDAVEAAKKVAALFGNRFIKAYIMGDAEHFDNRIIATVDKAGNVEISEEIAEVNDRRFLVSVHYDNNGANGMASKHFATADDAANYIIAFAKENPEYVINTDTNIRDFDAHKKYTLTDADLHILNSKPAVEEIAEINAADVKVNVADDGKVIEQIKVNVDEAIAIINRLNYRNDSFVYSNTTRYDNADIKCRHFDAYKDNGEKDAFAITEYVINGKLEIVRFFNLFRDITVDLQIGNVNYTIGDKGAIVLTDAEEIVEETPTFGDTFHVFEIGKTYFCSNNIAGKALIRTVTVDARTDAILTVTDNFGIIRKYHIDNAVNSEVVSLSEDIDAPKIYAGFATGGGVATD